MSGALPITPIPKEIKLISIQPIIKTVSASGKSQRRKTEGHLWNIKIIYDIMLRETIAPLFAFVAGQGADSFSVIVPDKAEPLGDVSGTILVPSGAKGANSISVNNMSGTLKAGDIFKFNNHSKVYMMSQDSSGSTLNFFPDLITSVNSTALQYVDVPFLVYLPDDVTEWNTLSPQISKYELNATEAIG